MHGMKGVVEIIDLENDEMTLSENKQAAPAVQATSQRTPSKNERSPSSSKKKKTPLASKAQDISSFFRPKAVSSPLSAPPPAKKPKLESVIATEVISLEGQDNFKEKEREGTDITFVSKETKQQDSAYEPARDASWKVHEPCPFLHLARTFHEAEKITGRLRIQDLFTDCFRAILARCPVDLLPALYLCMNKIAPDYDSIEVWEGAP